VKNLPSINNRTKGKAIGILHANGVVCLILGIILLQLILWGNTEDLIQYGLLIFIDILLFIGFFICVLSIRNIKSVHNQPYVQGKWVCKYCGDKFDIKSLWEKHEKSCVKMRI